MQIVFLGQNAISFSHGFQELLTTEARIIRLPDSLADGADRAAFEQADVLITWKFGAELPTPANLKLLHIPGTGYEAVDLALVPPTAVVCNCFGHEQPIAEYVLAALLMHRLPLVDADRRLRNREWAYRAGDPASMHGELGGQTVGLLGFGHIGRAVATLAKAFGMRVHVANRSPVSAPALVDRVFTLDRLAEFWPSADYFVVSVPLAPETRGLVDARAFAAMRPSAFIVNVGRGPTVDEEALFDALSNQRIAGAAVDTWYQYPSAGSPHVYPSARPFHELGNVVMTPHMSGWTEGTLRRRQQTMAANIGRLQRGEPLENVVRPAITGS